VASKFRLPHRAKLVDFCLCRVTGPWYCHTHRELAELAGGEKESGGCVEVWV